MNEPACHEASQKAVVKRLVLDVFGAKRVAAWCGVTDAAVYQWLSRATDEQPFPTRRVPALLLAARREGIAFDEAPLWALLGVAPEPVA